MAITFSCTCGRRIEVVDALAGQQGVCPACGNVVSIPMMQAEQEIQRPAVTRDYAPVEPAPPPVWESSASASAVENGTPTSENLGQHTTHAGTPIERDDDFFTPAPREIGRLFSVFTSLKTHFEPTPGSTRAAWAGGLFVVGFVITAFIMGAILGGRTNADNITLLVAVATIVGAIIVGIVYWMTGFSHTCNYVGDDGIAGYRCSGDRTNVTQTEFMLFRDATDLRISQTRHYYNGGYTGTNYSFTWSDQNGRAIFSLAGRFNSEAGTPVNSDPYWFALAAETAWSLYLLRNLDRMTTRDQLLFFGLTAGNHIQLGQDLIVLTQGGAEIELHRHKIASIFINNGVIQIHEHGAKEGWFSNTGIHQFPYADLGNARFFCFALEKLVGFRL